MKRTIPLGGEGILQSLAIHRAKHWLLAALFAILVGLAAPISSAGTADSPLVDVDPDIGRAIGDFVNVIVQKVHPRDHRAEEAITRNEGQITKQLPIVDGFSARVPSSTVDELDNLPGARAVTLDRKVEVQGNGSEGNSNKSVYTKAVRADDVAAAGFNGSGITVALIDTGITEVADLAGRILPIYNDVHGTYSPCVNLSNETHCNDSYGHGTFIAGIIAGNGASSGGQYKGVAPQANLVSVKISGRDGSADVSSVLAGIQWTVSFRDRYGIKVLNLSLGTNGRQSYRTDPLNYAVERAWNSGVAVIVSASNRGPDPGTISKPGDDPWVITVGAVDDRSTAGIGDDELPNFSSRGPTAADGLPKPDLVAPGAHIISLRSPGSSIDTQFPNYIGNGYRRGSGTSQATAVVSGAAALMFDEDDSMTPNRLKYSMMATAGRAASDDPMAVGAGMLDVYRATFLAPAGIANQGLDQSSGLGSLDASRGDVFVTASDPMQTVVSGSLTLQLLVWDPVSYTTGDWSGSSWFGSSWFGSSWFGSSWFGSSWFGSSWFGSSWFGQPNGSSWFGSSWFGSSWFGAWE